MIGEWRYSTGYGQLCQVIETQTLWGDTTCRVWLPARGSEVRIVIRVEGGAHE